MTEPTVPLKYDCRRCGIVFQTVNVKPRGEEDVVSWLKAAMYEVGFDHGYRSPNCPQRELDVYVPLRRSDGTVAKRIGDPLNPMDGGEGERRDRS